MADQHGNHCRKYSVVYILKQSKFISVKFCRRLFDRSIFVVMCVHMICCVGVCVGGRGGWVGRSESSGNQMLTSCCRVVSTVLFCCDSGETTRRFVGHTKDVLSVAFSADNRQIVSGSRDHTIKLWNTLGVCKYTIQVSVCVIYVVLGGNLCSG